MTIWLCFWNVCRSFGVRKSKVRSLNLDEWEPEHVKIMTELGNEIVNSIYEADIVETFNHPKADSVR